MKELINRLILSGMALGAIVSIVTDYIFVPIIIVGIFVGIAIFIYLKHELNNKKK